MRPRLWQPLVPLSPAEATVVRRIQRAKLFIFLRQQRHVLFSADFQAELATALYADKPKGQPPLPPARLALATILQAYTGVSDDEVIEATTMDRRWQLVLDCLDVEEPPFSKATLQAFRRRLPQMRTHADAPFLPPPRGRSPADHIAPGAAIPLRTTLPAL